VFKLTHTPARYDVTNKTILPPGEVITFEETLTNDGGLLEWISQKEHLVPTIAQLKLDKYLDDFRQTLKRGDPVIILGVGKLLADSVGRITFEQEPLALTRDILHVSPVIRQDASHKVMVGTKEMVNKQVVDHLTASSSSSSSSSASSSSAAAAPAVTDHPVTSPAAPAVAEYEYDGYAEEIPSRLRWLWIVIPAACVLIAVIVWYSVNKNRPQITRAESVVTPTPVEAVPVPAAAAPADTTAQVASTAEVLDYDVVFKVYNTRKAAEAMYKKQKGWGQPVVIIYNTDSSVVKLGEHFQTPAADTTAIKEAIAKKYTAKVSLEISNGNGKH
jgi:hypothetical protein